MTAKRVLTLNLVLASALAAVTFVVLSRAAAQTGPDPAAAVREFYAAVKDQDCVRAIQLRPDDYTLERCQSTKDPVVTVAETKYDRDGVAVVYIELHFTQAGADQTWVGHLKLTRELTGWIIIGASYDSKLDLEAYLKKYVTGAPGKNNEDLYLNYRRDLDTAAPLEKVHGLTFGSQAVLAQCWTPEQLAGKPGDARVISPDSKTDQSPAQRQSPLHPNPPLPPELRNSIRSVKPRAMEQVAALTFDLCERTRETTGYDAAIVNYLRDHNLKATFFAGGKWMRSHPDQAKQLMADPLFELGNHGWTHGNLRVMTGDAMRAQVDWTQGQYELLRDDLAQMTCAQAAGETAVAAIPETMTLLRFPFGTCSPESLGYLADSGLAAIQWSVVTRDPAKNQTARAITDIVRQQIKPGAIIIMHANGRGHGTAEALPMFIPELRKAGWKFVTVSELLTLGIPWSVEECYEEAPGDNLYYDKKFGDGT